MQTSLDPRDWYENPQDETARRTITFNTPAAEKRRLFPLSARLTAETLSYPGLRKGMLLRYARTSMAPTRYPVQCLLWDGSGSRIYVSFAPDEVEILAPVDES